MNESIRNASIRYIQRSWGKIWREKNKKRKEKKEIEE